MLSPCGDWSVCGRACICLDIPRLCEAGPTAGQPFGWKRSVDTSCALICICLFNIVQDLLDFDSEAYRYHQRFFVGLNATQIK